MRARAGGGVALLVLLAAGPSRAHELRPSLLTINEVAPAEYRVELRASPEAAVMDGAVPVFPPGAERVSGPERLRAPGQMVERFVVRVPGGWEGKPVGLRAAGGRGTEVLVRFETRGGRVFTGRLLPGEGDWVVPRRAGPLAVAGAYLILGVEHILTGLDHLAFVLGLILLTPAWRQLWKSVTAFTAAHSLTLALAALGVVRVPPPPVEAVIALSILFVAREAWLAARGHPGATARRPWPVAFAFGLLHGLGFAGALAQVGLPQGDIPVALFTFNVGVELGQLTFVAAVLLLRAPVKRLVARRSARWRLVPAYAIGALAVFWWLERVSGFWT
jgi:hydrogenase/urease accessory protein HupE